MREEVTISSPITAGLSASQVSSCERNTFISVIAGCQLWGLSATRMARLSRPMVVMYDAGRLVYWPYRLLRRWLLTTPHLSLMNILAGARIVPEFMPFVRDVDEIAGVARQLLTDTTWRALMTRQLDEIVRPLEQGTASARVCELIEELIAAPGGEHAASSQPVGRLLA